MKAAPALDPVAFLRATPPFDRLPRPAFESAARAVEIVFLPAGTRLLAHGDAPLAHLYVIRKGAVRLERSGETVQVLEEGELVGLTSLFSGTTPLDATVLEDVLAYRMSRAALHPLLADPAFAAHFASGLAERLRHSLERTPDATYHANFAAPVGSFVRRAPVRVPATSPGRASRWSLVASNVFRTRVVVRGRRLPLAQRGEGILERAPVGGLDPRRDAIIAVGMVPIRDDSICLGEAWQTLVRPEGLVRPASIGAHHIVPSGPAGAPHPARGERAGPPSLAAVPRKTAPRLSEAALLVHGAAIDVAFLRRAHK